MNIPKPREGLYMCEKQDTYSTSHSTIVISIPPVSLTSNNIAAIMLNSLPTSSGGFFDSVDAVGPVSAIDSYLKAKYSNRALVEAISVMHILEFGTFDIDLNEAKSFMLDQFDLDGESLEELISTVLKLVHLLFPELEDSQ
jgi:hypothetical protein